MCKLFTAGFNRPGYMPDSEPMEPDSFGVAARFIIEELQLEAERQADSDNDEAAEACDSLVRDLMDCAKAGKEWSGNAAGFEWWIKESAE